MQLSPYTGLHRRTVSTARRRHTRSNRLLVLAVTLILAVTITLGMLYVTRHGTTVWMSPSP